MISNVSDIVRYYQIPSDNVRYCQIFANIKIVMVLTSVITLTLIVSLTLTLGYLS